MNDFEARSYLHDNLYAPIFRQKVAELTGIQFESPEEEAAAQAIACRLKVACAQRKAAGEAYSPQRQLMKAALYSQMDRMAGNVLGDNVDIRDMQVQSIVDDPEMARHLNALNL